jgi:hypothetical protein
MKKTRIVTRVKDKTGIAKSKNRSEDLDELRSKYQQFSKNLKFLITTLTNNHAALVAHSKSRLEVAKAINSLTVDTPLFKLAGDIPATAVGTTDGGGGVGGDDAAATSTSTELANTTQHPASYAAVHLQLHKKNKMYHDKYTEHILNYAIEWERILSTRIKGHLAQSEKLRLDLDHYGRKVEDLSKTINKTMAKGKNIDDKEVDKLKRNEQKLVQARMEYDRFINDLCVFMEEVMDRGWKDLHPLLVKMAQFDTTLSNEEAMILKGGMTSITTQLKGMGAQHPNLKPQGRLKELETSSLESLAKANPSSRSDSPLLITQGGGEDAAYFAPTVAEGNPNGIGGVHGIHTGLGLGTGSTDELSVGGGGIFGRHMSRNHSFASNAGSETSYAQMPRSRTNTGDGSNGGGGGGYDWSSGGAGFATTNSNRPSIISAAPSSGGLPPLNPSRGYFSMSSHDLRASSTSSMLTTMQAAAPPPTLQDIFTSNNAGPTTNNSGSMMAPPPVGMPPPPPSMPPPPPPLSPSNAMTVAPLSLYADYRVPPAQQYSSMRSIPANNSGVISPQSAKSGSSNPFDDTFGGPAAGTAPSNYGNLYSSNNSTQMHSNVYGGGGGGGGGASTNPFGM